MHVGIGEFHGMGHVIMPSIFAIPVCHMTHGTGCGTGTKCSVYCRGLYVCGLLVTRTNQVNGGEAVRRECTAML